MKGARPVKISASLMCDSFRHLEASLKEMESAGVDLVHVDVMDGTFVPNFTLGPNIIKAVKGMTAIPVDVHLMSVTPEKHLDTFIRELSPKTDYFSIHQEACWPLTRSILHTKESGVKAGVALNPATSVSTLEHILPLLDFVLLMTVEPGFAGQKLVPYAFEKIAAMKKLVAKVHPGVEIEVDGNVSFEHAAKMVRNGANILVGGSSSVFKKGLSIRKGCAQLRKACKQ
jgi:ribulose-phosphate 3-epimerase